MNTSRRTPAVATRDPEGCARLALAGRTLQSSAARLHAPESSQIGDIIRGVWRGEIGPDEHRLELVESSIELTRAAAVRETDGTSRSDV